MQNSNNEIFVFSGEGKDPKPGIREGVERLWKETFHDSDEYVQLLFGSYYSRAEVGCVVSQGRMVSSMLGIPYIFELDGGEKLRGLYLCGLATDPSYRKHGLMGELLRRMEVHSKNRGYDFMFLIPADEPLRKYYRKFGFEDAFPKWRWSFVGGEALRPDSDDRKSRNVGENPCSARIDYFKSYDSFIENIENSEKCSFHGFSRTFQNLDKLESDSAGCRMLKSEEDLLVATRECFISVGGIYVLSDDESKILGIAYIYIKEGEVEVYKIVSANEDAKIKLLKRIGRDFPNCRIEIADKSKFLNIPGEKSWSGMLKMFAKSYSDEEIRKIRYSDIYLMLD